MSDSSRNQYKPDTVSPPGETLLETLDALGMTQAELSERTGRPKKTINEIIKGKAAITSETALQLERVLGIPARFWNNRERRYRESLARREERSRLRKRTNWLKRFPLSAMIRQGWVARRQDEVQQVREVLNFFGVASPKQWDDHWRSMRVAFRKSAAVSGELGSIAAWLRKGELVAQGIVCQPFDAERLRDSLRRARRLTVHTPQVFQQRLVDVCSKAGVAVAFVPALPKTGISGATRWMTSDKALIQLTLRYKTDDQLWFSFFHEAAHILLHRKKVIFIEDDLQGDPEEDDANRFAADILIPPFELAQWLAQGRVTKTRIKAFAHNIDVAPGIVVGRLQHDQQLPFDWCNDLKRRLRWTGN